jgi:hypothetical protein
MRSIIIFRSARGRDRARWTKIQFQRLLSDLRMERLHVDRGRQAFAFATEGIRGIGDKLPTPFSDLIRVDVEALRELGECCGAFDGPEPDLGLERR